MGLTKLANDIDKLPMNSKDAILNIIDNKTDENMEKVIAKIEGLQKDIMGLNTKMDTEIKSLEKDNNSLRWFMGSGFAIITILLTIIALRH
ncbi:MAG: hypothetical protein QM528_02460 [Phycisphaerales bacterium]|nr:hypothetical protein [Phycisphaerales bacterium]